MSDELVCCEICQKELPDHCLNTCTKCGKKLCGPCDRHYESTAHYELGFSMPHICRPCFYAILGPIRARFEADAKDAILGSDEIPTVK